jgi:hypothetical protein
MDAEGKPVAGCSVSASLGGVHEDDEIIGSKVSDLAKVLRRRSNELRIESPELSATTDSNGGYMLRGLRPGTWGFDFRVGSKFNLGLAIRLEPGQARILDVVYPEAAYAVSGRLLDPEGRPVQGRCVIIGHRSELPKGSRIDDIRLTHANLYVQPVDIRDGTNIIRATTDEQGRFEFSGIPYQTVFIDLAPTDPAFRIGNNGPHQMSAARPAVLTLVLERRLAISGVVVDYETGAPIRLPETDQMPIFVRRVSGSGAIPSADVGRDGRFEFYVDDPGPYDLEIVHASSSPKYGKRSLKSVTAPATGLRVILER